MRGEEEVTDTFKGGYIISGRKIAGGLVIRYIHDLFFMGE
jgi:hypothetical protein